MYRDRPSGFVKWWINLHGHDGNTKIVYETDEDVQKTLDQSIIR